MDESRPRLTLGLRRESGRWLIAHEHHSWAVSHHRGMSAHRISTNPSESHVRVEANGQVLAESDRAIELHETGLPTRYYLPREDVRMELLTPTDTTSFCPFKGDAPYYSAPDGRGRVLGLRGAVRGGRQTDRRPASPRGPAGLK